MPVLNNFRIFVILNKIKFKNHHLFLLFFSLPWQTATELFNVLCCTSPDLIKPDSDTTQFCLPPRFFISISTSVKIIEPIYCQKR